MKRRKKEGRLRSDGKSSKDLKNIIIPALRKEIKFLNHSVRQKNNIYLKYKKVSVELEKKLTKAQTKIKINAKTLSRLRYRIVRLQVKIKSISPTPVLSNATKLKRHCEAYYADKVFDTKTTPSFFASFLGFTYIKQWIKETPFTENEIKLIVIIYHHKWFVTRDAVRWGYTKQLFFRYMARLKREDVVYQYKNARNQRFYTLSPKGKDIVKSYETFYNKQIEKLLKNKPDNTPVMTLTVTKAWKDQI